MELILLTVFGFLVLLFLVLFFGCESVSSLFNDEARQEAPSRLRKKRYEDLHQVSR
ncbi:MAG: hypothetical protein NZM05_05545 [Chloroherpetonaceae bacterium]|nr:hypothetical protein [Chloroherpetonaceae bacterium]